MGSCDQGRIRLSAQFLNFSVTVNHLCLKQCFLFTSKQLPVDRLNISLSMLQYNHTRIQTWPGSERDALSPFFLPQTQKAFCKAIFPWHRAAGPVCLRTLSSGVFLPFTLGRLGLVSSPLYTEQAQLISITQGCHHLLKVPAEVTALLHILMGRRKSTGCYSGGSRRFEILCLLQVLCWRSPPSCCQWAVLINSTPQRAGGGQQKSPTETEHSWCYKGSSLAAAFGG